MDTPEFKQIIIGTYKLHEMIECGAGDTDAADAIRDEMESTWYKLTQEQQKEAGRFSGLLYIAVGK